MAYSSEVPQLSADFSDRNSNGSSLHGFAVTLEIPSAWLQGSWQAGEWNKAENSAYDQLCEALTKAPGVRDLLSEEVFVDHSVYQNEKITSGPKRGVISVLPDAGVSKDDLVKTVRGIFGDVHRTLQETEAEQGAHNYNGVFARASLAEEGSQEWIHAGNIRLHVQDLDEVLPAETKEQATDISLDVSKEQISVLTYEPRKSVSAESYKASTSVLALNV